MEMENHQQQGIFVALVTLLTVFSATSLAFYARAANRKMAQHSLGGYQDQPPYSLFAYRHVSFSCCIGFISYLVTLYAFSQLPIFPFINKQIPCFLSLWIEFSAMIVWICLYFLQSVSLIWVFYVRKVRFKASELESALDSKSPEIKLPTPPIVLRLFLWFIPKVSWQEVVKNYTAQHRKNAPSKNVLADTILLPTSHYCVPIFSPSPTSSHPSIQLHFPTIERLEQDIPHRRKSSLVNLPPRIKIQKTDPALLPPVSKSRPATKRIKSNNAISLPKNQDSENVEELKLKRPSSQGSFVVIPMSDDGSSSSNTNEKGIVKNSFSSHPQPMDRAKARKELEKALTETSAPTTTVLDDLRREILGYVAVALFLFTIPLLGVLQVVTPGVAIWPPDMPMKQINTDEYICPSIQSALQYSIPLRSVYILCALYLLFQLWPIRDRSNLNMEMKGFLIPLIPFLLTIIVADLLPGLSSIRNFALLLMGLWSSVTSIVYPTILSREEMQLSCIVEETLNTFDHILTDKQSYPDFKHFVTLQMYPENLQFYEDYFDLLRTYLTVANLKVSVVAPEAVYEVLCKFREKELADYITPSSEVVKKVRRVFKLYVAFNAPKELHISEKVKERVAVEYNKRFRHPVIFLPVWKEVYEELYSKSFRLYCKRPRK